MNDHDGEDAQMDIPPPISDARNPGSFVPYVSSVRRLSSVAEEGQADVSEVGGRGKGRGRGRAGTRKRKTIESVDSDEKVVVTDNKEKVTVPPSPLPSCKTFTIVDMDPNHCVIRNNATGEVLEAKEEKAEGSEESGEGGGGGSEEATSAPPVKKKRVNKGPTKKEKQEARVAEVLDWLPIMKKRANVDSAALAFTIENLHEYDLEFADPNVKCAYLLPLFHFLNETFVIADAVQQWETSNVSVEAAGKRVEEIIRIAGDKMKEEDKCFLGTKFGKRWWKIPDRDYGRVKALFAKNDYVKVTLIGIEMSGFKDRNTGKNVDCLMPKLRYEAYVPPAPKVRAPRKPKVPETEDNKEEPPTGESSESSPETKSSPPTEQSQPIAP